MEKELIESREGAPLAEFDDDAESVQQSGSGSSSSSNNNNLPAPVEESLQGAPSGSPNPQPQPSSSSLSSAPVQPDPTVVAEMANLRQQVEALTLQLQLRDQQINDLTEQLQLRDQQINDLTEQLDVLGLDVEAVAFGGEAPIGQEEDDELEVDAVGRERCRFVGCDQTLTTIASRNTHEKTTHSNIRPYQCNLPSIANPTLACNRDFKLENHVRTHLVTVHHEPIIRLGREFILLQERVDQRHAEWQLNLEILDMLNMLDI